MPTCWHEGNRAGAKLQMLEWLTLALPAAFESKAVFLESYVFSYSQVRIGVENLKGRCVALTLWLWRRLSRMVMPCMLPRWDMQFSRVLSARLLNHANAKSKEVSFLAPVLQFVQPSSATARTQDMLLASYISYTTDTFLCHLLYSPLIILWSAGLNQSFSVSNMVRQLVLLQLLIGAGVCAASQRVGCRSWWDHYSIAGSYEGSCCLLPLLLPCCPVYSL